ncbi:MAG TPA: site-specific DNA-methyltransferase, partial [Cyclobacteriaceae bacterium]|nr:site-specific DNA-methyltransferase [Cyclobacteriaceae bacterium]
MQNLLNELTELLSKDDRLVVDSKLLKNKITELALAMDSELIKLLLKNKNIKKHFFTDIEGILVFDKIKFQRFVSNKEFLPDSYTAFKNKIGLVNEQSDYITNSQEVVLAWPYKDCVLEGGQTKEDQKRDEIFWNETLAPDEIDRLLAPKVFTGWKRYDAKGEHELSGKEKLDFNDENLIIRGNNLLALHSIYKRFAGKINLIYIDPPYNTGNDSFRYNDSFNHSTWLSFMKNRLTIAKNLLTADGSIFIQIDNNE